MIQALSLSSSPDTSITISILPNLLMPVSQAQEKN